MPSDSSVQHRRSIRLSGYDYAQAGAYFVTICSQGKIELFGEITSGKVHLNLFGNIVTRYWLALPHHFPNVSLDEWVLMPNHLHGIIVLGDPEGRGKASAKQDESASRVYTADALPLPHLHGADSGSLGAIVGTFKAVSSRRINSVRHTPGSTVWQRNYFEHIIRNDEPHNHIREYIADNPTQWASDTENPDNKSRGARHTLQR